MAASIREQLDALCEEIRRNRDYTRKHELNHKFMLLAGQWYAETSRKDSSTSTRETVTS
jgi:hypothetical protein